MLRRFVIIAVLALLFSGCASVPMESETVSAQAKSFSSPADGNAGLYIYRSSGLGTAIKKDIWVDGNCIGETAPNMFFYAEVKGNAEHKISTESEFSANDLLLNAESGKHYFIKQYMKPGVFVGGAGLETVDEKEGKADIAELGMAKKGICSK
ncbi:MAG: DUF2846 domain-containing protein [Methyloglobulus sp.]|nr:DUF2846 domain-containing protein [Methyloglobulus sp.]